MDEHVVDTHALYWFLTHSSRLGRAALQIMRDAENGQGLLIVPSIVMAEFYYLNVKLKRALDFAKTWQALSVAGHYRFVDFTAADILQFDTLAAIPEMHDRIIAGVAFAPGYSRLTRDASIVNSGLVPTIW